MIDSMPYSNIHELNLDWVLSKVKNLEKRVNDVESQNENITNITNTTLFSDFNTDVYVQTYARSMPPGATANSSSYAAQGFCLYEYNDITYTVQCFYNSGANTQYITIRNYETGDILASESFSSLGHCNSICTDGTYLYVATAGGTSDVYNIVKLDVTLAVIDTYSFSSNIAPYGIAYNDGVFYVLCASSTMRTTTQLGSWDNSFRIPVRENYTHQGLLADDKYLYMPRGNWYTNFSSYESAVNLVDIFSHEMEYVGTSYIYAMHEIEEFDFLPDGSAIFSLATSGSALYVLGALKPCCVNINGNNSRWPVTIPTSLTTQNIYVNEDYTGWLQDGSEEHPLGCIYNVIGAMYRDVASVQINLLSDLTISSTMSFRGTAMPRLYINGNNNTWHNGLRLSNIKTVTLNEIKFTLDDSASYNLDVEGVGELYIDTCTFDLANCSTSGARIQHSMVQLESVTFTNSKDGISNMYTCGGSVRVFNGLTDDGGVYAFNSLLLIGQASDLTGNHLANGIYTGINGSSVTTGVTYYSGDVDDLFLPGFYVLESGFQGAGSTTLYIIRVSRVGTNNWLQEGFNHSGAYHRRTYTGGAWNSWYS